MRSISATGSCCWSAAACWQWWGHWRRPLVKEKAAIQAMDAVEGLAADSAALAFLATDLGFSGVLSVKPHLLRDASRFRLRTIQRIHALDSTGLETGLNSIGQPAPYAIAIAPAVTIRP